MRFKLIFYTILVVVLNFLPFYFLGKGCVNQECNIVIVVLVLGFFMSLSYLSYIAFFYDKVWNDKKRRNLVLYLPLILFTIMSMMFSYKDLDVMGGLFLMYLFSNLLAISIYHAWLKKVE